MQPDHVVAIDNSLEIQLDTKRTELNCYRPNVCASLYDRKWELSAGQKTCFLSVQSQQIRLRKDLKHGLLFEVLYRHGKIQVRSEEKNIENVAELEGCCTEPIRGRGTASSSSLEARRPKLLRRNRTDSVGSTGANNINTCL